jgi:taurine dioxygenase
MCGTPEFHTGTLRIDRHRPHRPIGRGARSPTVPSADVERRRPVRDCRINQIAAPQRTHLTAAIGTELSGVDLRNGIDPGLELLMRKEIANRQVVVIRDQPLTVRQHADIATAFGPILRSPLQLAADANVSAPGEVSTIEDTPDRPPAGFPWHTDLSWTTLPPTLGFLNAVVVPAYGGDTLWASTAAIFEQLTTAEQEQCERSTVLHVPDESLLASLARHQGQAVADRLRREHGGAEHPLVSIHPLTGRKNLYLSPLYARRIVGPAGADGTLLQKLHRMLDDPHMQMRWRWHEGDLVIWDETATCHRALTDHHPQRRVMRRCVTGTT